MSIYDGTPLQAAFDALAPTPKMWANAPEWAQWYAIDADAMAIWIDQSPSPGDTEWEVFGTAHFEMHHGGDLPLGIDWRVCKWQRPEVTA